MTLQDRQIIARLRPEYFAEMLGMDSIVPSPPGAKRWVVIGKIELESPIGIWLRILYVLPPTGPVQDQSPGPACLVRWEWITSSILIPENQEPRKFIGFRLDMGGVSDPQQPD